MMSAFDYLPSTWLYTMFLTRFSLNVGESLSSTLDAHFLPIFL